MIILFSGMFFCFGVITGLLCMKGRVQRLERDIANVVKNGKAAERIAEEHRARASRHENIILKASQMLNEYRSQIEKI